MSKCSVKFPGKVFCCCFVGLITRVSLQHPPPRACLLKAVCVAFVFLQGLLLELSLVKRKSVFGVCDQVRLKPACSTTETS